jgi:3-oxoacyl-[acyl-carrier protein] reductase
MQLQDKAAIVTGSATGVGRATALRLAHKGCAVVINYSKNQRAAEGVAEEVRSIGAPVLCVKADVSNDADCRAMVAAALKAFGRLDVLVNNAGTTRFIAHHDLDAVTADDWTRIMNVNLVGAFQVTRAAREALVASGDGAVVNVSSIAGLRAIGSSIPYCASKAALNNLTLSLARVLAPKVRVNAVAPAFITGEWLKEGLGEGYDKVKAYWEGRAALGKVCEPDDVAQVVMSLIAGADLITGQIIPIEGGQMLAM